MYVLSYGPFVMARADQSAQEMIQDKAKLRQGEKNYHDVVFEHEVNDLIAKTKGYYSAYVPRLQTLLLRIAC